MEGEGSGRTLIIGERKPWGFAMHAQGCCSNTGDNSQLFSAAIWAVARKGWQKGGWLLDAREARWGGQGDLKWPPG